MLFFLAAPPVFCIQDQPRSSGNEIAVIVVVARLLAINSPAIAKVKMDYFPKVQRELKKQRLNMTVKNVNGAIGVIVIVTVLET